MLYLILHTQGISNNALVQATGLPKETLKRFKDSIAFLLNDGSVDAIELSSETREQLLTQGLRPYKWSLVSLSNPEIEQKILELRQHSALKAKREFDQFFATPQTSYAKAQIMLERGLCSGKRLALLGDDDLVSITLGLLGINDVQIHVFDLDNSILTAIKTLAEELGYTNIHVHAYDARNIVPASFLKSFDYVMMDPPYTRAGMALFMQRGIEMLKLPRDLADNYIYLFYGNSFKQPEKHLKIQQTIQDLGLLIEDKINKFASYSGAESIGSSSSLYILRRFSNQPVLNSYAENRIYTYDNLKDEKFPFVDHYVFKIYGVKESFINSKKTLLKLTGDFCNMHKLKVVGTNVVKFNPNGFTVSLVLANSNLTLHTWPEHSAVHMDLVVCKPIYNKELLIENITQLFGADYVEVKRIE